MSGVVVVVVVVLGEGGGRCQPESNQFIFPAESLHYSSFNESVSTFSYAFFGSDSQVKISRVDASSPPLFPIPRKKKKKRLQEEGDDQSHIL